MKKLRAAIIGIAHVHAIMLAKEFSKYPDDITLVGMADVPPYTEEQLKTRLKLNTSSKMEIPFFENYKELLAQDIDIAILCTDVKDHAQYAEEILGMGINLVVEKPMAMTMADAMRMYEAGKKSTADLIINWPIAWFPAFRKAKELADSGKAGKILRVQYRSPATLGPYTPGKYSEEELSKLWWYQSDRGGGSICDYAGYGCVLTTWLTGKAAKQVCGFKKNFMLPFCDAEDYSVFAIDFGDSVGLIEGSWSTVNNGGIPTGPIIYGSEGVIVADRYDTQVKFFDGYRADAPAEVYETGPIDDGLALNVLRHIKEGAPLYEMITADFNMRVMAAFDAAVRASRSGQTERSTYHE